jgi:hypothetical protein
LFFVQLIIVIKIFIFSFFNLLFILFLHSVELISLTKFIENRIIRRLFHWIVSFSFAVWTLLFWFAILIMFLLITFAQINDVVVEFTSTCARDFSDDWDFFAIKILFDVSSFSFEIDFDVDFDFDVSTVSFDLDRIVWCFNRSFINFVIFCFIVFSNCWKFSNIVSQYDVDLFDFFVKLIDAKSKLFVVCIWSMIIDVSSVRSRFVRARSIWLINCCIITCSVLTILRSSNKIFCAFFNASSTDNINVRILIESYFFLSAFWRSSFVFFFRLIDFISSLWLEVDKSVVSVSLNEIDWFSFLFCSAKHVSSMLCSICWSTWIWLDWFVFKSFEFKSFEFD